MISVVNKHTHRPTSLDFYIGRGSPLGNPWTHVPGHIRLAKYRAATREEAIEKYAQWFEEQMQDPHSYAHVEVTRIAKAALHHDINLVCYCAPQPCHGEIIKRYVDLINTKAFDHVE